jgi:hypothetical protein
MLRDITTRFGAQCAFLLLAVVATGCDKVPLFAPTNSTVTLTAPTRSLPTGGTTQLTATVIESAGTPVQNGTTVHFTTSLGNVSPADAQTTNGVATATFSAGDVSGTADIRATSGSSGGGSSGSAGGTPVTSGTNVLQITIGAAAANTVTLTASPSTVPPAGGTVALIAAVLDASGNRLIGVPVTFSTTAGVLSAGVANTDSTGEARVQLTTRSAATVTAAAGGKTATANITAAGSNSISLSAAPTSPVVDQPVTLTVTPTIGTGNFAPRVVVDWGDGAQTDLGTVAAARTATHTYTRSGSYTITATATSDGNETATASIGITVAPRPVIGVNVTASSSTPRVNTPVTFTATVTGDTTAVISSYVWQFLDSNGNQEATTTTTGNAVTRVFTTTGTKTIIVTVNTADGRSGTGQTQIVVQP